MSALEAKLELEKALAAGSPPPAEAPRRLLVESIQQFPEVFQPRGPAGYASNAHVRDLAKAPKGGHALDAITVFWVGSDWAVIDGHHRLQAYRAAGWRDEVPVTAFSGSLDEAMGYAGRLNSGVKLLMSNPEKKALAWRLSTCTKLSKARIVRDSGMSDGFMAGMFRTRTKLLKEKGMSLTDIAGLSWHEAQKQAAGSAAEVGAIDRDAWLEEKAQDMANRILKALGKQGQQKHEVLARALEIYDSRLPDSLREFWNDERGEVEFIAEPSDPNSEF